MQWREEGELVKFSNGASIRKPTATEGNARKSKAANSGLSTRIATQSTNAPKAIIDRG